jgi:hypothetical protein
MWRILLRLLRRKMRRFTIPNQSPVPKAYQEFDETGRMPLPATITAQWR